MTSRTDGPFGGGRVKLCGIRSAHDLAVAAAAGADAAGFLCGLTHVSEDALEPGQARELIATGPSGIMAVLVTHLTEPDAIAELAAYVGAGAVQVHGEYPSAAEETQAVRRVRALLAGRTVLRAVHVGSGSAAENLDRAWRSVVAVAPHVDGVLLDSRTPERLGGTGRTHDWAVSARIRTRAEALGLPVVLAGGLTPVNVAEAIVAVGPAAVDVNSGIEVAAGAEAETEVETEAGAEAGTAAWAGAGARAGDKDPDAARMFVRRAAAAFAGG